MSEAGLYVLTKIAAGAVSALMTGPYGSIDLPAADIERRITENISGHSIEVMDARGEKLGFIGSGTGRSPEPIDLPDHFIQALLATEDARFGAHPGVDPLATMAASIDTLRGNQRGGSTITQQLAKNAVTGSDLSLDRKIQEAIIAIRIQSRYDNDTILQSYLAHAWFGRGQKGASGASLAWFGKKWSDVTLEEAALLAGMLKGPAYYDPEKYPQRALERRNIVLQSMHAKKLITDEELSNARMKPITVISSEEADRIMGDVPHWIEVAALRQMDRRESRASLKRLNGDVSVTTTYSKNWQEIAEAALKSGIERIGAIGAAGTVSLKGIEAQSDLTSPEMQDIRRKAAGFVVTSPTRGRAIVHSRKGERALAIIDRGYGDLVWEEALLPSGYKVKPGDVMPYEREDGKPRLIAVSQVQGAVMVMDPSSGAILASVGGYDVETSTFDRTHALRQPGSSIKPFLWLLALENGLRFDDYVEDVERNYPLENGQVWRPRNYDGTQSGLIPLYVGLEESSNLVAANLINTYGVDNFGRMTELAGLYDRGQMRRELSSALGASETTLERMAAGYSAIVNGGRVVAPHVFGEIRRNGQTVWDASSQRQTYSLASIESTLDMSSMLYGATTRGTGRRAFRDSRIKVAGKTGTTQNYRDAWFMSFTPGATVAVWVGRDDFKPIPGNLTGSSAAAPIARTIYDKALESGLMAENGFRADQVQYIDWPPSLLDVNMPRPAPSVAMASARPAPGSDPFKRPLAQDPESMIGQEATQEDDIFAEESGQEPQFYDEVTPLQAQAEQREPRQGYLSRNNDDDLFGAFSRGTGSSASSARSPW